MRVFQATTTNPYFPKGFTQGGIAMEKLGLTVPLITAIPYSLCRQRRVVSRICKTNICPVVKYILRKRDVYTRKWNYH